jgi:molecular chaperone GrpE (heat shock protein)
MNNKRSQKHPKRESVAPSRSRIERMGSHALHLELETLRRDESRWLEATMDIFDHIFALRTGAARSNQPKVTEQVSEFQSACRSAASRLGLDAFTAQTNELFNATLHRLQDAEQKPLAGAIVSETLRPGYTFRGAILRPALVRLLDVSATPAD